MRPTSVVFPLAIFAALTATLALPADAAAQGLGEGAAAFDFMADLVVPVILAIVFTIVGLVLFGICIWLIVKIAPFSVRKEIEEDQNTALGIIVGAMILGIAIILASALIG